MKNTFKKIAASIMAVASLAISATGVVASAADVTTPLTLEYQGPETDIYFGDGAHAYAYADSQQINLRTTAKNSNTNASVLLDAVNYVTFHGGMGTTYAAVGSVSHNYSGTGISYAHGIHESGNDSTETARYVG